MKTNVLKGIANRALSITKANVNSLCMCIFYQPTLPKQADKLKI